MFSVHTVQEVFLPCKLCSPHSWMRIWWPDPGCLSGRKLEVHWLPSCPDWFQRKVFFVPIVNIACLSESQDKDRDQTCSFFWTCSTTKYPFIIQLLISPGFICLFAHVAVQSYQNGDQLQKAIFSCSYKGRCCYASSIQSSPLVFKVYLTLN